MVKSLVVVESPTKARTVKKLLDRKYEVMASMGHVKDLPRSQLGVDVEHEFTPKYVVPKGKGPIIKELKAAAKKASAVYLATDPDREGEAISWHLATILTPVNPKIKRIEFHEVTKDAVRKALQSPRDINASLVNAQQARRILDRLVGYKISPLLWRKIRGGLSAGRVQSVAVRLICEREQEIEAFVPQEYWSIAARLAREGDTAAFVARLVGRTKDSVAADGKGGEKIEIPNEAAAKAIVQELEQVPFSVSEIRRKDQQRHPAAPFTTSTLQQEANRKLGYSAARTMVVAQQLYEGMDVGAEGTVGLITYMRTDAVRVADEAQGQARDYIGQTFGAPYVPAQPRQYTSRRNAQGAHEAIRPTSVLRTPEVMKPFLKADQHKVYRLIWERFVASQMASAVLDTLAVDITAGPYLFRATGSRVKFPGFLRVYMEGRDTDEEDAPEGWLPDVQEQERLRLLGLDPAQHFTQPPPRYTEATLVRALEERGIGRPSTYAPIIETVKHRGYVEVEDRRMYPTELGILVNSLLVEHFAKVVDVDFTAHMEEDLDRVEEGQEDWVRLLRGFYGPFAEVLHKAEQNIEEVEMAPEEIGEPCPRCGKALVKRRGRFGLFIACSGYPECSYTRPVGIGVRCPTDGGEIVERRTRKGRMFFGCANYPACTFTSWDRPTGRTCPVCGQMLVAKRARRGAPTPVVCSNKTCEYKEAPKPREVEQVGAPS
ncbi:MAG: type I DNA topoisomerase [Bacillati bacterium ANGP1]|uniref:DNA topoisomerase 1 n=1 Tax=Candidatus Segetimicrobium genomatis TaxID=2569760 RepID=A0A537K540_9BACT|nr:MAG: type I DNA topoisomerase [Terrabacteria group bacterium ANGP1]